MLTTKNFLMALISGLVLFVSTISANAQILPITGGNCLFSPGPYAGLNLGWAKLQDGNSSHNVAGGLFLGYDFTPHFATEISYNHLSRSSNMLDLLARLNVPVSPYVSVFGKAGPAWISESHGVPSGSILPEAGVGLAFLPAHNTKVQVAYNHVFGIQNRPSLHYVAVGLAYKFAM